MRMQSLALAATMRWDQSSRFRDSVITPHPVLRHLPHLAQWMPNLPLTTADSAPLPTENGAVIFPAILITCGRRMAGVSIALKRRAAALGKSIKTVHIQDPRLNPALFDVLIVPQHDPARGPNVIVTKAALNRLTKAVITKAATALPPHLQTISPPRVAVLLGGDNKRYKIAPEMAENMCMQLEGFATATGASLLLVPSRRCPPDLLGRLQNSVKNSICLTDGPDTQNPYPGVLGIVEAVIVTADSVNMVSEAASTGLPVMIASWTTETGRIAAFHEVMRSAGHTVTLARNIPKTKFPRLDENAAICQQVTALLSF